MHNTALMECLLQINMRAQPTDTTCGPTCLHALYGYYGDKIPLDQVVEEVPTLESGGTLAVLLANHALRRGYRATIYTYNVRLFDPTWFADGGPDIRERLQAQRTAKKSARLRVATAAYLQFLDMGGRVRFEDLTRSLICKHLNRGQPILSGLSSTYLYHASRETEDDQPDDVRGDPVGHFVVLSGYDRERRMVTVADPLWPNPISTAHNYEVNINRVVCAVLLGIVTHDANLLVITPGDSGKRNPTP